MRQLNLETVRTRLDLGTVNPSIHGSFPFENSPMNLITPNAILTQNTTVTPQAVFTSQSSTQPDNSSGQATTSNINVSTLPVISLPMTNCSSYFPQNPIPQNLLCLNSLTEWVLHGNSYDP